MSTIRLDQLQPRDVVPAAEADARIAALMGEIDDLRDRVRDADVQLRSAEDGTPPGETAMSQSAQLTVQFVEDLVATNRERMRDVMSQRYAWVGERLADAEAEAQAIRDGALADLTAALRAHDATLTRLPDHGSVADIIASVARSTPPAASQVRPDVDADGPASRDQPDGEPAAVPVLPVAPPPPVTEVPAPLAGTVEAATAVDEVVESAVQAVLRALTEPQTPIPAESAVEIASPPAHRASIVVDEDEDGLDDVDGPPPDALRRADQDFWGGDVQAEGRQRSRVRPRDLLIVMVALLAVVLVVLLLVG